VLESRVFNFSPKVLVNFPEGGCQYGEAFLQIINHNSVPPNASGGQGTPAPGPPKCKSGS